MKKLITICTVVTMILAVSGTATADSATAYVGTVNGTGAFTVQNSGTQLYFHPQPDTDYVWMNNNGSPPGTIATYTHPTYTNGITYNRDGLKTFAATDIAYGATLNAIKMQFDFYTGVDTNTGYNMSNPSMNIFLTDGAGHYGIWSATSGSATYTDTVLGGGWTRRVLDCTTFVDDGTDGIAIYEHNGFVNEFGDPYTKVGWDDIKNFSVAGFYDYQRTPSGGFEAWNQTLWTDITNVGVADTTLNEFGITINWGDTVGGMYSDGSGEIGAAAERAYAQAGRLIDNYILTVGATTYDMSFEAGVVPEPATLALLGLGGLLIRRKK